MLDSIEKDNKTISQMYKGDELVWEMPEVMTSGFDLYKGTTTIEFTTYPADCKVKIEINGNTISEQMPSGFGGCSAGLESPLKNGDKVVITISKPGWKDKIIIKRIR
ncbi:hypothetical protein [Peptoniphilus genitalis]|uniref:hypothetical protein n=1 Tax=Peptoniphilus genitalis TaxID=3036303 RepID=UPI0024AE6C6D|nr:hypothetical protein [Peptoniphilus sp. Marseille-Q7072]